MCRARRPSFRFCHALRKVGGAVLLVLMLLPGSCREAASDPAEPRIGRFPASHFLIRHDLFLPSTDPATQPAAAERALKPNDEVFGVKIGGRPRAYPMTMLAYHHVVNDSIGKSPLAVTY